MSAGFTPGPWRVVLDAFHVGNRRVVSFHPAAIAKVYGDEPKDDDPKATANANLIAAAPDLFMAVHGYLSGCTNDECEACIIGRAALAKARGDA